MPNHPDRDPDEMVRVAVDGKMVTLQIGDARFDLSIAEARYAASRLIEAAAAADGLEPEKEDWDRLPMQYLLVEAERVDDETDGDSRDTVPQIAEVHCWVKDQTRRNALHVAEGWIAGCGWVVTKVIEQRCVGPADFAGTKRLRYYEQALLDEEVFLFETDAGNEEPADAS